MQDEMFLQYLTFVDETETDPEVRAEKLLKAVDDYLIGKKWKKEGVL